jgi:hypothetical protein
VTCSHTTVVTHLYVFQKQKNWVITENGIRAVSSRDIGKVEVYIGTRV